MKQETIPQRKSVSKCGVSLGCILGPVLFLLFPKKWSQKCF